VYKAKNEDMKKMNYLLLISIVPLVFSCKTKKDSKMLNIVFIAVDDLRAELGCYGNTVVKSPNLNKLAEEGVLFTNHYANGENRQSLNKRLLIYNIPL